MPEDIALFIDFENIRYSMLNIQRREPDPQELIAVARRYGTVMVARAYADWSRQPEPFKGSLTAAMIDRVDCPAKQRDRIRMGTVHYASNAPTGRVLLVVPEQGTGALPSPGLRPSLGIQVHSLQSSQTQEPMNGRPEPDVPPSSLEEIDDDINRIGPLLPEDEQDVDEEFPSDFPSRDTYRPNYHYGSSYSQSSPTGPLGQSNTGPLGYSNAQHTGNTGHMSAVNPSSSTIVQSTVVQSTVDLNMLMDIIETVFDRPTISTFVLMTGDKDFTRISARLKLRLNKTVIVVGIPGTVSRDLISSANQFVPLVPGGVSGSTGSLPVPVGVALYKCLPVLLVLPALARYQQSILLILLLNSSYHMAIIRLWMCSIHSFCNFWIILTAIGPGVLLSVFPTSLAIRSIRKIAFVVA